LGQVLNTILLGMLGGLTTIGMLFLPWLEECVAPQPLQAACCRLQHSKLHAALRMQPAALHRGACRAALYALMHGPDRKLRDVVLKNLSAHRARCAVACATA
jgi:hypothetical protein